MVWPYWFEKKKNVNKKVFCFSKYRGKKSRFLCTLMVKITNFYFDVDPSQYVSYSRFDNKIIIYIFVLKTNMLYYNMLNVYFMGSFPNLHNEYKVYRGRGRSGRRERKKKRNCPRTELSR